MNSTLSLNYATGTGWAGVNIPYYGGSLVMTAILPDSGQFDSVKASLNAAWFASFDNTAQQQQVGLALPKFTLTTGSTVSWKPTLQTLGMTTLFDASTGATSTGLPNKSSSMFRMFYNKFTLQSGREGYRGSRSYCGNR